MAEDSRNIFEKVRSSVRKVRFPEGKETPKDADQLLDKIINSTVYLTDKESQRINGGAEPLVKAVREGITSDRSYMELRATIKSYEAREKLYFDEHNQLKVIEHGQGLRNLIWRAATTFTIASIIFFFYWLADCLEITMPLSRVAM